jgi:4-hydroxymandelate oxidase
VSESPGVPVRTQSGSPETADLSPYVSVRQFRDPAEAALEPGIRDYVAGGAGDELTLHRNEQAWQDIRLAPRILVDVSELRTDVELFGLRLPHPLIIAPTARHRAYHPGGELETMSGARAAQALYVQSSLGSTDLADIAAAGREQPWWFQLYVQRDRGFTAELVAAAVEGGAKALVLTVDVSRPLKVEYLYLWMVVFAAAPT